jgi:hypothetical protein
LPNDPVLVVHGGAWAMPDDMVEAHLVGVRNALGADAADKSIGPFDNLRAGSSARKGRGPQDDKGAEY